MDTRLDLDGRHIVLGLSGGIACYKAADLTRALVKAGATVQVVMSEGAEAFITPVTLQALSGRPVYTSQWDARPDNNMAHINLSREADAILVAPASADFMAKLVQGRADDLLTLMCPRAPDRPRAAAGRARDEPRDVGAPGHAAQRRAAARRRHDAARPGRRRAGLPRVRRRRMLEAVDLRDDLIAFFAPKLLRGKRVLVTAGPTFEASIRCVASPTFERQDGLRDRARRAGSGRRGHADRRPGAPVDAARRAPHRRAERARHARRRDAAGGRERRVRRHRGRRRLASPRR